MHMHDKIFTSASKIFEIQGILSIQNREVEETCNENKKGRKERREEGREGGGTRPLAPSPFAFVSE